MKTYREQTTVTFLTALYWYYMGNQVHHAFLGRAVKESLKWVHRPLFQPLALDYDPSLSAEDFQKFLDGELQ